MLLSLQGTLEDSSCPQVRTGPGTHLLPHEPTAPWTLPGKQPQFTLVLQMLVKPTVHLVGQLCDLRARSCLNLSFLLYNQGRSGLALRRVVGTK